MPPVVAKTRGVKIPSSTLRTRSLGIFSFLWCLVLLEHCGNGREQLLGMLGWKTRTSKNASCCVFQNPLARISRRALSSTFAKRKGVVRVAQWLRCDRLQWEEMLLCHVIHCGEWCENLPCCRSWHSLLRRLLHSYSSRGCLQDSIRISGIVSHKIHLCEGKICGHPEGGRSATRRHPLQWQDQQSTAIVGKACRRWQRSLVQTWIL